MRTTMKWIIAASSLLGVIPAYAAPFTISADGTEVTDIKTGLIWRRCAEGESGGDCTTGMAVAYTHEGALAHAQTQTGWRLPSVKELASIVDRSRSFPALDSAAFPLWYSRYYHWSSSPYAGYVDTAWYVFFGDGTINGAPRNSTFYVRLVR